VAEIKDLQKIMYCYQETFLKEVRMDQYYKMEPHTLEK
jgi:hypothetical protein